MELKKAATRILNQLSELIESLSDHEYIQPLEVLNNATIGQHIRHTLEFFMCLQNGYSVGVVNYDKRDHDKAIESDRMVSLFKIEEIASFFDDSQLEKKLVLQLSYSMDDDTFCEIDSNFSRELAYNIEHGVHHMAIIKIGAKALRPDIQLSPDFGVAVSTIRYQNTQPQQASA